MLAILAALCFLLATCGLESLGPILLLPLGLVLLALHMVIPLTPWQRA